MEIIYNSDDFGISKGTNQAILKAFTQGCLNSTSLMVNLKYTSDALKLLPKLKGMKIGLHLNLTNEKPLSNPNDIPLLVNKDGRFRHGFLSLFITSLLHPISFKRQVEREVEAQILYLKNKNIPIEHIASHRYSHMIPSVFKVVKKMADKYQIKRIRVMNENIFKTMIWNKDIRFLFNLNIIKYIVLKSFAFYNHYKTDTYFYSILYTGCIFYERVKALRPINGFKRIEIGLHPNIIEIDQNYLDDIFDKDVLSQTRKFELKMLLNRGRENEKV